MTPELKAEILARFKDVRADWTSAPFAIGDKACATNRYALVAIPGNDGLEDYSINCGKVYPIEHNTLQTIAVEDIRSALALIPKIEEEVDVSDACQECDGDGEVRWEYGRWTMDADCPVCDGSGNGNVKLVKTGKMVYDDTHNITINGGHFRGDRIEELLWVADKMGVQEVSLVRETTPNYPKIFVVGECELLLMPSMKVDGNPVHVLQTKRT
jgi:hypothetical protein